MSMVSVYTQIHYNYYVCTCMHLNPSSTHDIIIMVQTCAHNFIRNGTIAYIHMCTYHVPIHVHTL